MSSPNTWKDAEGREWPVCLTLGRARMLRDRTGVDLVDHTRAGNVADLLADRYKLADVLWFFAERKAKEVGVNREAFDEGLDADALTAGWGAISDEFVNFCQPSTQDAVRRQIDKDTEAMELAAKAMAETISSPETDAAISRAIAEVKTKAMETLASVGKPSSI